MNIIRHEAEGDLAGIRYVHEKAFERPGEADLVDSLRDREAILISLVAERDGQVVGHIAYSLVQIKAGESTFNALGLAPLAVLPQLQRQGVGTELIESSLDDCRREGHALVIVLGHPDYYTRFGFTRADAYGIVCEFDVPPEAFMVKELQEDALTGVHGTVFYAPEFHEI
jgi:putative acetyltransferase